MALEPTPPGPIRVPVRTFAHPETASRVTYVSTVHVGEAQYWARLARIIEQVEHEGGRVYYEQVRRPSPQELQAASPQLRWGAAVIERKLQAFTKHAASMGLVAQLDGLPQRDGWQVHDVTTLRAAQIYGSEALRRQDEQFGQFERLDAQLSPQGRRTMLAQMLTALLREVAHGGPLRLPGAEGAVARTREGIVLAALDAYRGQVPDARVALVWGAGHLPAFTDALAERGYKQEDDEAWVTVLSN